MSVNTNNNARKSVMNEETNEAYKSIFSSKTLNEAQMKLIVAVIALFDQIVASAKSEDQTFAQQCVAKFRAVESKSVTNRYEKNFDNDTYFASDSIVERIAKRRYTRQELRFAHAILREKLSSMSFVSHNDACKRDDSTYDLNVLRVAKAKSASKSDSRSVVKRASATKQIASATAATETATEETALATV